MYATSSHKTIPSQLYQIKSSLKELDEPNNRPMQIFNQLLLSYKTFNQIILHSLDVKKIEGYETDIDKVNEKVRRLCKSHIFFREAEKTTQLLDNISEFETKINELRSGGNARKRLESAFANDCEAWKQESFKDLYKKDLENIRNLNLREVDNRIYRNNEFIQFVHENCPKIRGLILRFITDDILPFLPKTLNYLSVDYCSYVTQKGWNALAKLPSLNFLYLRGVHDENFKLQEDAVTSFAQAIKSMTSLKALYMEQRDGILHVDIEFLASLPKELQSLEFEVSGWFVGKDWSRQIRHLKHLESLSFTSFSLPNPKKDLKTTLNKNLSIQKLTLLKVFNDAGTVKILAKALRVNQTLLALDLTNNNISDKGAFELTEALKVNRTLIELNLDSNRISSSGISFLSEALKVNDSLKILNLSGNKIGDEEAKTLSKSLKENESLQALNLSFNKIGNIGAQALAKALKVNRTLIELNLGYNAIYAMGRQSIIGSIKDNDSLKILDISHDGATSLNGRIESNKSLQTRISKLSEIFDDKELKKIGNDNKSEGVFLELEKCSKATYGTNDMLFIIEAIKGNKSLKILDISENTISDEEMNALNKGLEENKSLKLIS